MTMTMTNDKTSHGIMLPHLILRGLKKYARRYLYLTF